MEKYKLDIRLINDEVFDLNLKMHKSYKAVKKEFDYYVKNADLFKIDRIVICKYIDDEFDDHLDMYIK